MNGIMERSHEDMTSLSLVCVVLEQAQVASKEREHQDIHDNNIDMRMNTGTNIYLHDDGHASNGRTGGGTPASIRIAVSHLIIRGSCSLAPRFHLCEREDLTARPE